VAAAASLHEPVLVTCDARCQQLAAADPFVAVACSASLFAAGIGSLTHALGAVAALIKPLAKACGSLADELQQATQQRQTQQQQQQQQQPPPSKGMRSGFFSAGSRQQQQQQPQRQPAANLQQGLSLARTLIMLWSNITIEKQLDSAGVAALFSDSAACASILPAVKLMLVMLQAQSSSNPASTSHTNEDSSSKPWAQVQAALATAVNVAQAITVGPHLQRHLRSRPGVMQLLTAPDLHQLLWITAAWMAGLLHQQKQGRATVHTSSIVRSLSNSSAAAPVIMTSSSDGSGSSIAVPPHHIKVLELLGAPAADPGKHSSPASAKAFCNAVQQALDTTLPKILTAAGLCLEISHPGSSSAAAGGGFGTGVGCLENLDHGSMPASSSSSSSSSNSGFCGWQQLSPVLVRMLTGVVQLMPCAAARQAAVMVLMPVVRRDMGVWQQPAGAAVASELVMQLGPAVLHAVQQQQQSQEDAKNNQYALWFWASAVMNTIGRGGWLAKQRTGMVS
jgi:hypothetical protein